MFGSTLRCAVCNKYAPDCCVCKKGNAMNERIEQLVNKLLADESNNFREKGYKGLVQFAELIVKECADFISPLGDWCGGHGEPTAPNPSECARQLKKHFGVK